jgi:hypothetical protein
MPAPTGTGILNKVATDSSAQDFNEVVNVESLTAETKIERHAFESLERHIPKP